MTPAAASTSLARSEPAPGLFGFLHFHDWRSAEGGPEGLERRSEWIGDGTEWNEAVVSWNVEPATGAVLEVDAQEDTAPAEGDWRRLGTWSLGEGSPGERTSLRGQQGEWGAVKTDTLVLARPATRIRIRLRMRGELASHPERLRWLTVSLVDTRREPVEREPLKAAWGRTLDVPERSQVSFAEGRAWCSPTSVSMVLGWWARTLGRAELDRPVPEVAAGVYDPGWSGTGNWPFNMAYAGSVGGLRACAVRLRDLRDVETMVAAGVPVVLSVNAPALRGKPVAPDGGHLVTVVGFTETGDPVVNDPWARLEEGQRVRRVYPRANVVRAWAHAHRLAYWVVPADRIDLFPGRHP